MEMVCRTSRTRTKKVSRTFYYPCALTFSNGCASTDSEGELDSPPHVALFYNIYYKLVSVGMLELDSKCLALVGNTALLLRVV